MAVQFALWERQVFVHFYVNKPRASTDNFQQWPIFQLSTSDVERYDKIESSHLVIETVKDKTVSPLIQAALKAPPKTQTHTHTPCFYARARSTITLGSLIGDWWVPTLMALQTARTAPGHKF